MSETVVVEVGQVWASDLDDTRWRVVAVSPEFIYVRSTRGLHAPTEEVRRGWFDYWHLIESAA